MQCAWQNTSKYFHSYVWTIVAVRFYLNVRYYHLTACCIFIIRVELVQMVYVQKVPLLVIIIVLCGILYLQVVTIKNIQKFSSMISTSNLGMRTIYVWRNVLRAMPNLKANSIAYFSRFCKYLCDRTIII